MAPSSPHRHSMHRELHQQPEVVRGVLDHYRLGQSFPDAVPDFRDVRRVVLVACGSSYHACLVMRHWLRELAQLPADVELGSEARFSRPLVEPHDLALFLSQSGETTDTHGALARYRAEGVRCGALLNVVDSAMGRDADFVLPVLAGPEQAIASTKAFTAQLSVLACVALRAARDRGQAESRLADVLATLQRAPQDMARTLAAEDTYASIASKLTTAQRILYLGRGTGHGLALEGALKTKETSYVSAEGFAAGELRHGPMAMVDAATPILALAPEDEHFAHTINLAEEVSARGAPTWLFSDEAGCRRAPAGLRRVPLPKTGLLSFPLVYAVPLQLVAYHLAVAHGHNVDHPRNLEKAVTE